MMIISMFGALGVVPTILILLAVMAAVVVCACVLEQRGGRARTVTRVYEWSESNDRAAHASEPEPSDGAVGLISQPADEDRDGAASAVGLVASSDEVVSVVVSVQGSPEAAVVVGSPDVAIELTAVMFAAYVVLGLDESSRVTGWITAAGTPPSIPSVLAGDRLRGRATRIREVLECADEHLNWITLDPSTDIALAVGRRPPADPTLIGLLGWWRAITCGRGALDPTTTEALHHGLQVVLPGALPNPLHETLCGLAEVTAAATEQRAGLTLALETDAVVEEPHGRAATPPDLLAVS